MSGSQIIDSEPTAFVDESLRPGDHGLYVIACVVVVEDVELARAEAEKVPPDGKRFHWKDERRQRKHEMIDRLKGLGAGLWSYECHPCPTNKQERARAKCLERLLWDLNELGATQLVIESRGDAPDRKDRQTILSATKSGVASTALVYEHRRPTHDPGLWLADALAGAAATALTGHPEHRIRLGNSLDRTSIAL